MALSHCNQLGPLASTSFRPTEVASNTYRTMIAMRAIEATHRSVCEAKLSSHCDTRQTLPDWAGLPNYWVSCS